MRLILRALTLAATIATGTIAHARECGESLPAGDRMIQAIHLQPRPTGHTFYLRTGQIVVLVDAHDVQRTLQSWIAEFDLREDVALLDRIDRDIPLREQTDIFKYAFDDPRFLRRIEFVVAALLQEGNAALVHTWQLPENNQGLQSLRMVRVDGVVVAREFCSMQGELLLQVTDVIRGQTK